MCLRIIFNFSSVISKKVRKYLALDLRIADFVSTIFSIGKTPTVFFSFGARVFFIKQVQCPLKLSVMLELLAEYLMG